MAKIIFNNKNYEIDPASLSEPIANLESHLSTIMSGTGATIKFGDSSYNVDSTKLSNATNTFVTHLGTIAGSGLKVVVGGVEYGIDLSKISGAVADLEAVLGGLNVGGGDALTAGLYQTGAIALYEEQGAEAIEGMLITPWDELVANGYVGVDNGAVSICMAIPDNLPVMNEYGFYYGVTYNGPIGMVFNEDASVELYGGGNLLHSFPAGTAIYSSNCITIPEMDDVYTVTNDGVDIVNRQEELYSLASPVSLQGDLMLPSDGSVHAIDDGAFFGQNSLTGITIPDSVVYIGSSAFCRAGLTSVVIDDGIKLDSGTPSAFAECVNLTSIIIPGGASISYRTFEMCSGLTNVTILDGVSDIGQLVFYDCSNLTSVDIPFSVTHIGFKAFMNCVSLTTVNYGGTMAQWNAIEKDEYWDDNTGNYTIYCTDGNIEARPST